MKEGIRQSYYNVIICDEKAFNVKVFPMNGFFRVTNFTRNLTMFDFLRDTYGKKCKILRVKVNSSPQRCGLAFVTDRSTITIIPVYAITRNVQLLVIHTLVTPAERHVTSI